MPNVERFTIKGGIETSFNVTSPARIRLVLDKGGYVEVTVIANNPLTILSRGEITDVVLLPVEGIESGLSVAEATGSPELKD